MTLSVLLSVIEVLTSAVAGLTTVRLWRSGLYRRYPVLFSYIAFQAPYILFPVVLDSGSRAYFRTWIVTKPVLWTMDVLVVRELCRVVLERHSGLYTLGRWMMYGGVAVSGFISFLSLLPHMTSTMPARSRLLAYWMAADRGISLSLVIFLLLMLLAVSRYPVRLSRNVILNAVLFTVCFLCDSLTAILTTVFDLRLSLLVYVTLSGVVASCLLVWLFYLTPEGEQAHFDWIQFGHEYEKRVLARLDALNRVLQKAD